MIEHVGRVGMVARWKPVHLGQAPVLRGLCAVADETIIGIGSANRMNARNPFTPDETEHMIRLVLAGSASYRLVRVPDLDDGPRWRKMLLEILGPLDLFVTANPYVASLLEGDWRIIHPVELVSESERVPIDGTMVRRAMARGNGWRELVPAEVADYILNEGLDQRFRREFGLEILAAEI